MLDVIKMLIDAGCRADARTHADGPGSEEAPDKLPLDLIRPAKSADLDVIRDRLRAIAAAEAQ